MFSVWTLVGVACACGALGIILGTMCAVSKINVLNGRIAILRQELVNRDEEIATLQNKVNFYKNTGWIK